MTASITDMAERLTTSFVKSKDTIIREAICRRIGDDWKMEDINHRCHYTVHPEYGEVYFLDSKAIVRFGKYVMTFGESEYFGFEAKIGVEYAFIDESGNDV